jgi:hypothetical protein
MHQFLELIAVNQLLVIVLSGIVWTVGRRGWTSRRSALVHGLWLLVFLKCITPPLISLPLLPSGPQQSPASLKGILAVVQNSPDDLNSPLLASDLSHDSADDSELEITANVDAVSFIAAAAAHHPVRLSYSRTIALRAASLLGTVFIFCKAAFRIRMIAVMARRLCEWCVLHVSDQAYDKHPTIFHCNPAN